MSWGKSFFVFVMSLFTTLFCLSARAQVPDHFSLPCVEKFEHQLHELDLPGTDLNFPLHVNLNCPSEAVTHLIVVLHGTSRTGKGYFKIVRDLLPADDTTTLVVAPQFLLCTKNRSSCDEGVGDPDHPKRIFWGKNDKWKGGGKWALELKLAGYGKTRSSFWVMDRLLKTMIKKYPNIQDITLVGHSAGGQFLQRYAATSALENDLYEEGRETHFVVANSSSYLYFHPFRRHNDKWRLPFLLACPNYNHYRYGLEIFDPVGFSYLVHTGPQNMRDWYPHRRVTYLLGKKDDHQNGNMDNSCAARLQGKNRLERGKIYYRYMNDFFAGHEHDLALVPDVGHDAKKMFSSPQGQQAILWWE